MEWFLLIIAGVVAIIGLPTNYRYIAGILFAEFLIMIGYQEIFLDSFIEYSSIEQAAAFYMAKSVIQAMLFMLYMKLDSKFLSGISLVIIGYLWYTAGMALYGIDNIEYVEVMTRISVLQLLIGLAGVSNGYWHLSDNIRHYLSYRAHKGM